MQAIANPLWHLADSQALRDVIKPTLDDSDRAAIQASRTWDVRRAAEAVARQLASSGSVVTPSSPTRST